MALPKLPMKIKMNKTFILKNDLAEIKKLTEFLCKLCEENNICNKILCDVTLAIEEIFTNIVHHAYDDKREHHVEIRIKLSDEEFVLNIIDDGKPFNPLEVLPANIDKPFEERDVGGLGVHLVRSVMDELVYKRNQGKNVLAMRKRLIKQGSSNSG